MSCNHKHNRELNRDPTGTTTLRKKFVSELFKRNREVRGTIRAALTSDTVGLKSNVNEQALQELKNFDFSTDPKKLDSFGEWLDDLTEREYLSRERGPRRPTVSGRWTDTYIKSAHKKGIKDADQKLKNAGMNKIPNTSDVNYESVLTQSVHAQKLQIVYSRTWKAVKGVKDEIGKQVSRILAEGIAQGKNPYDIARDINSEIKKIHNVNEKVLARTEVINAHAESTLDRFEQAGVQQVQGQVEFSTAGDTRVCDICNSLVGEIIKMKNARGLIPVHPQCRCAWLPVVGEDTPDYQPSLFPT